MGLNQTVSFGFEIKPRPVCMLLRIIGWRPAARAVLMFCNYFILKKAAVETVDSVFCSSAVLNPEVASPHQGLREESERSRDAYRGRKLTDYLPYWLLLFRVLLYLPYLLSLLNHI